MKIIITKDNDRIDGIVYEHYGSLQHLQFVLDANPGIAKFPVFPAGIEVTLPDIPVKPKEVKRLWT